MKQFIPRFETIVLVVVLMFYLDSYATKNHINLKLTQMNHQINELYFDAFPERKPKDEDEY